MPDFKITITLDMAQDAEEFIRKLVREEIALHMERTVRYRGWGPAAATTPRFLRQSEIKETQRGEA
jgi:hypothetical protein